MALDRQSPTFLRFGTFEVDLRSGEVRKQGKRIKLQEQPFQVLAALLQRPSEVVTREELRKRIWPEDTFVDFDNSLNTAINKLREALGDCADNPRFIETLPRRGYRWMVAVEWLEPGPTERRKDSRLSRKHRYLLTGTGIAALVLVGAIYGLSIARWRDRLRLTTGSLRVNSLAVLPLANLSGDSQQDYFADGMTDELTTTLAQIGGLRVTSRTSSMQFKDTKKSLPQIAKDLNVDAIVEGTVVRSGDRIRITAQLIEGRTDRHLWAKTYERDLRDVLALQDELATDIADEIRVQLTPQQSERFKTTRPVDPTVYDTALKGKAVIEYATSEEQIRQAIELFQKAVDRDPTYAPAWAGLGQALWSLAGFGFEFVAPADVRDKAIAAAEKALHLDPNLADAHKARAMIAIDGEWDLEKAQRHFEKALELRPSYADAHNLYGQMLSGVPLPRFDEGRRHLDQARELDPLSPWNDINSIAWWLYQGQPEKALEEGERASQRNPTLGIIRWQMGFAQLNLEQPSQAVLEFEAALQRDRRASVLAPLGLAYGLAGRRADALKILAEMKQASRKHYISPFYLAVVYSGLGRMDDAFRLLDEALEQRNPHLVVCMPYQAQSIAFRRDQRWKHFIARLRQLVRLPPGTANPYS